MADIVFGCFVLYGLIFGLRRGFYKELIAFTAFVVAVAAARTWKDPAGELLHTKLGWLPAGVAHAFGGVVIWIVAFFLINVIGRIILKKLRDPDAENVLEKGAEEVADSVEGDTKQGPMTLLTNPVATAQKQLVYWSDKILGGLLGIAKGAGVAYALFAVVYFVDLHTGTMKTWKTAIEQSKAAIIYTDYLAGLLRQFPEFRIIEHAADTERLVEQTKGKEPQLIERLAQHPNWAPLKATDAFRQLALDPEIQGLWAKHDLDALVRSPKVRHLLADDAFKEAFANVDVEEVMKSIANPPPAPPPKAQ